MSTPPTSPSAAKQPRARVTSVKRPLNPASQPDVPETILPKRLKQDSAATDVQLEKQSEQETTSARSLARHSAVEQPPTQQPPAQEPSQQQSPIQQPTAQQPSAQQPPIQQPTVCSPLVPQLSVPQLPAQQSLSGSSAAAAMIARQNNFMSAFFELTPTELSNVGEAARIIYGLKTGQTEHTPTQQVIAPLLPRAAQRAAPQESASALSRSRQPIARVSARASSDLEQQSGSPEPLPVSAPADQQPIRDDTATRSNAGSANHTQATSDGKAAAHTQVASSTQATNDTQTAGGTASSNAIKPFPTAVKDLHAAEQYATGPKAELRRWKGDGTDLPDEAERWQTAKSFYDKLTTLAARDSLEVQKPVKYSHEWIVLISWRLEWRIYDICNLGSFMPKHNDRTTYRKLEEDSLRSLAYKPRVQAVLQAFDQKSIEYVVAGAPDIAVKVKNAHKVVNKGKAEKASNLEAEHRAAQAQLSALAASQKLAPPSTTTASTDPETIAANKDGSSGGAENDYPMEIDDVAAAPAPAPASNSSVRSSANDMESVEARPNARNSPSTQDKHKAPYGTAALDPDNLAFTSGVDEN